MAIRNADRIELELALPTLTDRAQARVCLMMQWTKEQQGRKYRYFAETFADGRRLYLERPGPLNKGCDFVIFLEDAFLFQNGNDRPPSHGDIFEALDDLHSALPRDEWAALMRAIQAEHALAPLDNQLNGQVAGNGLDVVRLTALCRWFFLEQDLTYWNGQGRDMLWNAITGRFP